MEDKCQCTIDYKEAYVRLKEDFECLANENTNLKHASQCGGCEPAIDKYSYDLLWEENRQLRQVIKVLANLD